MQILMYVLQTLITKQTQLQQTMVYTSLRMLYA